MKWGMMRIGVVKEGQALQGALNRAGIRIITITRSMDGGVCVCGSGSGPRRPRRCRWALGIRIIYEKARTRFFFHPL